MTTEEIAEWKEREKKEEEKYVAAKLEDMGDFLDSLYDYSQGRQITEIEDKILEREKDREGCQQLIAQIREEMGSRSMEDNIADSISAVEASVYDERLKKITAQIETLTQGLAEREEKKRAR